MFPSAKVKSSGNFSPTANSTHLAWCGFGSFSAGAMAYFLKLNLLHSRIAIATLVLEPSFVRFSYVVMVLK